MWNWKVIYEDNDYVCYLDIDNITDSQADEDGLYSSIECYHSVPDRVVVLVMFFIKKNEIVEKYKEYLKEKGSLTEGYMDYNNSLCLIELDAEKGLYRAIPAVDYTSNGKELGMSKIITDKGKSFIKGLKGDWSSINSRYTNKAIPAIFRFLYRTDSKTP